MRVFVINLDRRPDRLQAMSSQLTSLGLSFERISAIDGRAIRVRPSVLAWLYGGFRLPFPGAVACFLSHQKIWRRMVEERLDQVLVLEDDATPIDWDDRILYIRLSDHGLDLLRLGGNRLPKNATSLGYSLSGRSVVAGNCRGSCAYLISNEGARRGLRASPWFPMDDFPLWADVYSVRTAVVVPLMWMPSRSPGDVYLNEHTTLGSRRFHRRVRSRMRRFILAALSLPARYERARR